MRYAVLCDIDTPDYNVCGILTERDDGTARIAWPCEGWGGMRKEYPDGFDAALQTLSRCFLVSTLGGTRELRLDPLDNQPALRPVAGNDPEEAA